MNSRLFLTGLALYLAVSCRSTDPLVACQTLHVTAPTTCYQAGTGLVLTADASPVATLVWVIAPFADTLIEGGKTYVPRYFTTTTNTVTIPDSIAGRFPKIGVGVSEKDCDRTNTVSLYFSFVRRPQQGSACVVWQQQEMFVLGD
jgi:hypothetical protein